MRKILLILALAVGLAGCAVGGNVIPQAEVEAQFGPLPENYQALVMAYASRTLIDPESARYEFFQPVPKTHGWFGQVWVNAKNRFGGYVGKRLHVWRIVHGQVAFFGVDPNGFVW
jgi:hypothetical protein